MKTHKFKKLEGSIGPVCQHCSTLESDPFHKEPYGADVVVIAVEEKHNGGEGTKDVFERVMQDHPRKIRRIELGGKAVEYTDGLERCPAIDQALDLLSELPEGTEERKALLSVTARAMAAHLMPAMFIEPEQ